jgi:hypothetical protein
MLRVEMFKGDQWLVVPADTGDEFCETPDVAVVPLTPRYVACWYRLLHDLPDAPVAYIGYTAHPDVQWRAVDNLSGDFDDGDEPVVWYAEPVVEGDTFLEVRATGLTWVVPHVGIRDLPSVVTVATVSVEDLGRIEELAGWLPGTVASESARLVAGC